ncbi:MAG: DUF4189 domain-containing protein [Cyanobacteria bacterium J06631_2]
MAYTEDIYLQSKSTSTRKKQLQTNNDRKNTGLLSLWNTVNSDGTPIDILCYFRIDGNEDCSYTIYRQSTQTSQRNKQDKYGSIAVHGNGIGWGTAWNHSSAEAASNAALKKCFESSRGKCKTAITFKNGCGALATALATYGSAASDNKLSAQQKALEVCRSDYCQIETAFCND